MFLPVPSSPQLYMYPAVPLITPTVHPFLNLLHPLCTPAACIHSKINAVCIFSMPISVSPCAPPCIPLKPLPVSLPFHCACTHSNLHLNFFCIFASISQLAILYPLNTLSCILPIPFTEPPLYPSKHLTLLHTKPVSESCSNHLQPLLYFSVKLLVFFFIPLNYSAFCIFCFRSYQDLKVFS